MRMQGYDINAMADNIGKAVEIIPLDKMKGKIVALYVDDGEPSYEIAYFMNGERKMCYLKMDEITHE